MEAKRFIDDLNAKGVSFYGIGDRLKWRAPKGALAPDDMKKIPLHKHEILKLVENRDPIRIPEGKRNGNLIQGDCSAILELMPTNSVDVIVTDPPYGYKFMGKDWDKAVPSVKIWKECLRVLKPGAFAFIMSSPRQDCLARMIVNLESAGFKTGFTSLYWTYATGFPKAHNISKAIDKRAGVEPKAIARNPNSRESCDKSSTIYESGTVGKTSYITAPVTKEAIEFEGAYGGFQPKPAVEVILVVQKPPTEKTQRDQALKNGKGVTWLDDCRIPYADKADEEQVNANFTGDKYDVGITWSDTKKLGKNFDERGRFPANLLVSDDILDDGKERKSGHWPRTKVTGYGEFGGGEQQYSGAGSKNTPESFSRFFSLDAWAECNLPNDFHIGDLDEAVQRIFPFLIVPKASKKEKEFGCEGLAPRQVDKTRKDTDAVGCNNPRNRGGKARKNHHPTVKHTFNTPKFIFPCIFQPYNKSAFIRSLG